jgi:predicted Rossmann fold nucleotide-binding protein DprA/Smf involved in DNA uptake
MISGCGVFVVTKMLILVSGTRYAVWNVHADQIRKLLRAVAKSQSGVCLVHGGALGVDQISGRIAAEFGWDVVVVPADWSKYGKSAGPKRNQKMLDDYNIDRVVAFPAENVDSKGTWDTISRAQKAGKIISIYPVTV